MNAIMEHKYGFQFFNSGINKDLEYLDDAIDTLA